MGTAQRFKHTDVPRQMGELGRFKVVQGPDYGAIYVVVGPRASLGRGEDCDIVISDLKASRLHAEIFYVNGAWNIKDKGSANGILLNGKVLRESPLKLNDIVTIGESTLEFTSADAATAMLTAPPRSMQQIQQDQKNLEERQKRIGAMGLASLFGGGESSSGVAQQNGSSKSRILILSVIVLAVGFFMLPDGGNSKKSKKKKEDPDLEKNLAAFLPTVGSSSKAADTFFKDGFREYLAGNFNRARVQFETVLQITPGHTLATIYLENCNKAIETEIKYHLDFGKKSYEAGKLRDSRSHYERILRLLYKDQSNENFIKAKENFEKIDREIKEGGGKS